MDLGLTMMDFILNNNSSIKTNLLYIHMMNVCVLNMLNHMMNMNMLMNLHMMNHKMNMMNMMVNKELRS